MPLAPASSAVHLQPPPSYAPAAYRAPTAVTIHPAALFAILDHYLRRSDAQARVIGTLLGSRTEGQDTIDVRGAFAVLHSETDEQVAVDMEYHHTMYELSQRVNPKDVIVGWYSTGSDLNTYSALIQNFYSQETAPAQAIHVSVNTGAVEGDKPGVRAYISAPVGVFPKPENAVFVPIPVELKLNNAERGGIQLLTSDSPIPTTDLSLLESSIESIIDMLDRVLVYVRAVLAGNEPGDPVIGRYLIEAFGAGADDIEKGGFTSSLQDTLMMSYLANLARAQAEVSSRLALVTAA